MTPELNAKCEAREVLLRAINATNSEDWRKLRHEAKQLARAADKVLLAKADRSHDTTVPF